MAQWRLKGLGMKKTTRIIIDKTNMTVEVFGPDGEALSGVRSATVDDVSENALNRVTVVFEGVDLEIVGDMTTEDDNEPNPR